MASFPAKKIEIASAKVEALVAVHSKALVDAETEVKALDAKVEAYAAVIARHEEQLARPVLRRLVRWLFTYEGIV